MNLPEKLDGMSFSELFELAGRLRFESSMLCNRTLHEFDQFVHKAFFDEESTEYALTNAYGVVAKAEDEPERLRRLLALMIIHNYPEWDKGEIYG